MSDGLSETVEEILAHSTYVLRPEPIRQRSSAPEELPDLSDDDYEARIADTALIATHAEACAILVELDSNIAHIQTQIDLFATEATGRAMPENRRDWLRRAAYACAIQRSQRHRVLARDRELRNSSIVQKAKKDREERMAQQARLTVEAEGRKLAALVQQQQMQDARHYGRLFVKVAKERLPPETVGEIDAEVRARGGR